MARSRCLKVPKSEAERRRRALAAAGALRTDLGPDRDARFVYLPVKEGAPGAEGELCERDFEPNRKAPASYRDLARVPANVRDVLPRSYDVIGRVIVIKIPDELAQYREEIGRALLQARPEARSVAQDRGVQGEDRVRCLSVIAGEPDLWTVHVEHGIRFELDPSKVYFSPRLATERLRVTELVKDGEAVLDMFAGVGPFSIMIAKRANPSAVRAADINPAAIEYLKRNIRLNKVSGVEPLLSDARELPGKVPPADRIIMNLPHSAFDFLPEALGLLRPGGTIHLYEIIARERKAERTDAVAAAVEFAGRRLAQARLRLVRGYSKVESHFVFDLTVG
jgi:tRNA (guanine37-N1)-methyltransferase